jgi:outer membrane lipoprotein SlyB
MERREMPGAIGNIAGAMLGGPTGAAIGGAVGSAVDGGGDQQAQAFQAALQSFAMQIANDSMGEFDDAMADTDEDFA